MEIIWLFVIASSIWVWVDSRKIRAKCDANALNGLSATMPVMWFLGCMLLWIVVFPLYLITRPRIVEIGLKSKGTENQDIDRLSKIGQLRDAGVLTEKEFRYQKNQILGLGSDVSSLSEEVNYHPDTEPEVLEPVKCDCGKRIRYKKEHRGKNFRCPSCQGPISIPL